jgi:hypothetical protein
MRTGVAAASALRCAVTVYIHFVPGQQPDKAVHAFHRVLVSLMHAGGHAVPNKGQPAARVASNQQHQPGAS